MSIDDVEITKAIIEAGLEFYPNGVDANEHDEKLLSRIFKAMFKECIRNTQMETVFRDALLEMNANKQQLPERNDFLGS